MAEQVSRADGRELREPLQEPLRLRALSDARRPDKNDSGGFAEAHSLAFACLRGAYSGTGREQQDETRPGGKSWRAHALMRCLLSQTDRGDLEQRCDPNAGHLSQLNEQSITGKTHVIGTQPSRGPNRGAHAWMLPEPHAWQRQQTEFVRLTRAEMASSASRQQMSPTKEVCLAWHRKKKKAPLPPASLMAGIGKDGQGQSSDGRPAIALSSLTKIRTCILLRRRSAANTKPDADVAPVSCLGIPGLQRLSPLSGSRCSCPFLYQSSTFAILKPAWTKACSSQFCVGCWQRGSTRLAGACETSGPSAAIFVRDWLAAETFASGKSLLPAWRNEGMRKARSVHASGIVRGRSISVVRVLALQQLLGWCCAGVGGSFQQASSASRDLQCLTRPGSSLAGPLWGERGARDGAGACTETQGNAGF